MSRHEDPDHDRDDCCKCQTDRIIETLLDNQGELMATFEETQALLDQLVAQEQGETKLQPGQVAVFQTDLDAMHAQLASLIDPVPAPPVVAPPPAVDPTTGLPVDPNAPPVG